MAVVLPGATFPVGGSSDGSNLIVFKVDANGRLEVIQAVAGTAAIPWSMRLSDGTAFYDGAKTGQLPTALVGGRLDVIATQNGTWTVRNQDGAGNNLASSTSAPTGTEQALVVRNIPSGTQAISAATLPLPTGALSKADFEARINTLGQKTSANSTPVVLASDQSSLPITIGTQTVKTFTVIAQNVVLGNNKSLISILNGTGSNVVLRILRIWLMNAQTTNVSGVIAQFNVQRITGHSLGAVLTPLSLDTDDSLNVLITVRTGATVTGETATPLLLRRWSSDEWTPGGNKTEQFEHALQALFPLWEKNDGKTIVCRPNEGLHVKCATNTTAGQFDLIIEFTENPT